MVSVNRVYRTVLTMASSDIRGNVTPTEYNLFVNDVVEEIYEEYLFDVNRLLNRQNRGLMGSGLENLPARIREKIQHFSADAAMVNVTGYLLDGNGDQILDDEGNPISADSTTTIFQYPADHRWTDVVYYNGSAEIEICPNMREFKTVSGFSHTRPTVKNPIGIKQGPVLRIAPITITDNVMISYLRNPVPANWTFTVIGTAEIFNPDAPDVANVDLHESEFNNVVVRVAKRFGINLKESDLTAVTTNEQGTDYGQENQP